jgi:hypothetical protein
MAAQTHATKCTQQEGAAEATRLSHGPVVCCCCCCCRYRDALSSMTEAQSNFATALAEFGCGSDQDSLIMGEQSNAYAMSS